MPLVALVFLCLIVVALPFGRPRLGSLRCGARHVTVRRLHEEDDGAGDEDRADEKGENTHRDRLSLAQSSHLPVDVKWPIHTDIVGGNISSKAHASTHH